MADKKALKQGKIPVKRTINMAEIGQVKANYTMTILVTLLIGVLALIGVKFGVIDRLQAASDAELQVTELQMQVDMVNATIASYGDITTAYGHYTYSDMTQQELAMVETMDIIQLLEDNVMNEAVIGEWTLNGNVLTIPMVTETLEEANTLVQILQTSPIVDFCTVTTAKSVTEETKAESSSANAGENSADAENSDVNTEANTGENSAVPVETVEIETIETVTAQVTVYLVQPEEEVE